MRFEYTNKITFKYIPRSVTYTVRDMLYSRNEEMRQWAITVLNNGHATPNSEFILNIESERILFDPPVVEKPDLGLLRRVWLWLHR